MLVALATFSVAAVLIILLPGPDTMVVLRGIARGGRSGGIATAAGILVGLAVWVGAAALGLAALLRASHVAYEVLRIAGGAYLMWLGIQSLRALHRHEPLPATPRGPGRNGFVAGLLSNLANPKVGVFFVTFLPGFVPHGYPVGAMSLLFGALFIVMTIGYYAALVGLAERISGWLADTAVRRRLDAITGTVLVAFGVRLAVES